MERHIWALHLHAAARPHQSATTGPSWSFYLWHAWPDTSVEGTRGTSKPGDNTMKRAILYIVVLLLPALSALPFAPVSAAAGAKIKVGHPLLAASGGTGPARGNYST